MAKKVKQNNFEIKCLDDVKAKKYPDGTFETLDDHTIKVRNVANVIKECFNLNVIMSRTKMRNILDPVLMTTCVLHDVGKFDKNFQTYIRKNKETKIKFIRHNISGYNFIKKYLSYDKKYIYYGQKYKDIVAKNVLYHHVVYDDYKIKEDIDLVLARKFYEKQKNEILEEFGIKLIDLDNEIDTSFNEKLFLNESLYDEIYAIDDVDIEPSKHTSLMAAVSKLVASILLYADRLVSSDIENGDRYLNNDVEYIKKIYFKNRNLENKLKLNVDYSYDNYDKLRLKCQLDLINEIVSYDSKDVNTFMISASAGCGKTLMGLQYMIQSNRRLLWVVPTVNLAEATYRNILDELDNLKLKGLTVGLMYGGVIQNGKDINQCDIIVAVIDSFLSYHSKNNFRTFLINAYDMDIVFDEYHEFICDSPLFGLFNQIMFTRTNFCNAKTILMSATPPKDIIKLWHDVNGKIKIYDNNEIPIQGENVKLHINFMNKDFLPLEKNSIYYMGTLSATQIKYTELKKFDKCNILHSYYTEKEKKEKYEYIFEHYGFKSKEDFDKFAIFTTTMLGVGWNISVKNMFDVIISPDSTIQKCGRMSRWLEYTDVYYYICEPENEIAFNVFLKHIYDVKLNNKWKEKLREYDGKVITKGELYKIYDKFYEENRNGYRLYLYGLYNTANTALKDIKLQRGNSNNDKKYIASGMTYRGLNNSYYVTVEKDNDYIDPVAVPNYFFEPNNDNGKIRSENNDNDERIYKRYKFIMSGRFDFSDKDKFKITDKNSATFLRCKKMAKNPDSPLLLCDFEYDELGLHHKNLNL